MTIAASDERIMALREQMRLAHTAASTARTARRASQEASRSAGALADQRAAADAAVAEAVRRLRAVHGLRPVRLAHLLRGRSRHETLLRAEALEAASVQRDAIAAQARAHLDDVRRLSAQADAAAAQAAALPRLLDELARLIHDAGGDDAVRLAAAEASIGPPLTSELALSHALQATRHARTRIQEAIAQLVTAHAWGARGADHAMESVTAAVLMLRRDTPRGPEPVREATDRWLCWVAGSLGSAAAPSRSALEEARRLDAELGAAAAEVARQRAQVRHAVAGSRAVRIEILCGAAA